MNTAMRLVLTGALLDLPVPAMPGAIVTNITTDTTSQFAVTLLPSS
jgi:hypothetical protein